MRGGLLEALEGRRLMSVAGLAADDDVLASMATTVKMPAVVSRSVRIPQVSGGWVGSCKVANAKTVTPVSMQLNAQRGQAATGRFNFGPISGGRARTSTAIVSTGADRGFYVIFQGKGYYGSVNGAISDNGRQIIGRWAFNGAGGWKVGTLVLNRV